MFAWLTRCEGCLWVSRGPSHFARALLFEEALTKDLQNSYVGNKIAVFTMQSLGCDVAALNTVQFSMSFLSLSLIRSFALTG